MAFIIKHSTFLFLEVEINRWFHPSPRRKRVFRGKKFEESESDPGGEDGWVLAFTFETNDLFSRNRGSETVELTDKSQRPGGKESKELC